VRKGLTFRETNGYDTVFLPLYLVILQADDTVETSNSFLTASY